MKYKMEFDNGYIVYDIEKQKVLEISFMGWTLKRGAGKKKLRAENEYLKKQVAVLHSTLLRIMMTKKAGLPSAGDVMNIYDWTRTALDEYSTNEFNRRCELESE